MIIGTQFKRIAAVFGLSAAVLAGGACADPSSGRLGYDPDRAALAGAILISDRSEPDAIQDFYRARGFAPLWTAGTPESDERLRALAAALARAPEHGLPADRFAPAALTATLLTAKDDRSRMRAELAVTRLYLDYAAALSRGILDPRAVDSAMKRTVHGPSDEVLLKAVSSGPPAAALRALAPTSVEYTRLMREKRRLESVTAQGGWGAKVDAAILRPGDTGPAVVALRDRLMAMGHLERHLRSEYDDRISAAVAAFQTRTGLEVDGVAGPDTIAALNVSAEQRLGAVLVAMERERWLDEGRDRGRVIVVNLPEFAARVFDDGREVFHTRAVVGAIDDGKPTPEFSDEMTHLVVNPSWYVPPGIIRRDYLPKLQANPWALSKYEIVDRKGRPANRSAGFRQYSASSFPFSIRQEPGPDNALGLVKFMFPNPWSIYLHDTPAKNLFDRDRRAYSSGCVRLADPFGLARLLLSTQEEDADRTFRSILDTGRERRVNLEQSVPVHLIYRTAFISSKGELQFRDDIYGRDAKVLAALEREGVALGQTRLADAAGLEGDGEAG